MEYAERAVTLAPNSADGYMAVCVCKGRLALFSDNKTKASGGARRAGSCEGRRVPLWEKKSEEEAWRAAGSSRGRLTKPLDLWTAHPSHTEPVMLYCCAKMPSFLC